MSLCCERKVIHTCGNNRPWMGLTSRHVRDVCFLPTHSGHHVRGTYQPGSHRIFNPPSFCGACLNFSREKDSAIPFRRRRWSRVLCTNDLIVIHPLGTWFFSEKIPFAGIELTSPRVKRLHGYLSYRGNRFGTSREIGLQFWRRVDGRVYPAFFGHGKVKVDVDRSAVSVSRCKYVGILLRRILTKVSLIFSPYEQLRSVPYQTFSFFPCSADHERDRSLFREVFSGWKLIR